MSEANVAIARRGYEAMARGDLDAVRELLDPEVEWHGGDRDASGACHSRGEALAFIGRAIDRGRVGRLVDVIDAGDQVVVVMQPPARASVTPDPRANLTTFKDGRVVTMVAFESPGEALAAARRGPARHER